MMAMTIPVVTFSAAPAARPSSAPQPAPSDFRGADEGPVEVSDDVSYERYGRAQEGADQATDHRTPARTIRSAESLGEAEPEPRFNAFRDQGHHHDYRDDHEPDLAEAAGRREHDDRQHHEPQTR